MSTRQGINAAIWGDSLWTMMYAIVLNYPDFPTLQDKTTVTNWFESLATVIPCIDCRTDYRNNLKTQQINTFVSSKIALCSWLVTIHNITNTKLNDPLVSLDTIISTKFGGKRDIQLTEVPQYIWMSIYSIVLDYPETPTTDEQNAMKLFFESLCVVMPGTQIKTAYNEAFDKYSLYNYIVSKTELCKWLVLVNNYINNKEGKQPITLDSIISTINDVKPAPQEKLKVQVPYTAAPKRHVVVRKKCCGR